MRSLLPSAALAFAALAITALAADVANMTGTWKLNVDKSRWGKKSKPVSATVTITHSEPSLEYNGSVVVDTEGNTKPFEFKGAIDGKPYPIKDDNVGEGKITFQRADARTIRSEAKSNDGKWVETAQTELSKDGKTLTRRLTLEGPTGKSSWYEVYERM